MDEFGDRTQCLGFSKSKGTPRHPLMLAYATPHVPFNPYEKGNV
jgi:hypothetical protein